MSPQLIVAAIIAALGFGTGWQIQSWRYNAKEAQHAQQELAQVQHSAAAAIRRVDNVLDAQNQATDRAIRLRRDLDGARSELDRMRNAIARHMPGPGDATSAEAIRATTAEQLLIESAEALTELAGQADRHANDAKTLSDAWPK